MGAAKTICKISFLLVNILVACTGIQAQDNTIPGEITTPFPTLKNLAVEWEIQGDNNLNGRVEVAYRVNGTKDWEEAMPLFRVPSGENIGFTWNNKHSGSIFDLEPNTKYEIRLRLSDPDGGEEERKVNAHTRPVPKIDRHAKIIELPAGDQDTLFTESGTPGHPSVYRCTEGKAVFKYIDLQNREWVFIDGLTITNLDEKGIAIQMNGAENCVVRGCTINAIYGIVAYLPGASNCYISDNVVTGICEWSSRAMGSNGDNIGEGIQLTGPGNVICYNRVTGFRDCISTMEDSHVSNQTCIDIYNNDIYRAADDAIEADFCFSNCRIYRNRITNCYIGLSSQPGLGGPNYFVRNAMYNLINGGLKLQRYSQGDVILHNTMIKIGRGLGGNAPMDHAFFRNNLAIGGPTTDVAWGKWGVGNPWAADIRDPGIHSSFDYDAVGVHDTPYIARIGDKEFAEVEKHGTEKLILHNVFDDIEFPNPPVPERPVPDLRPKAGSRVVDAAVFIPNINKNYKGEAPDCGAYEVGQELPHYGPRNINLK